MLSLPQANAFLSVKMCSVQDQKQYEKLCDHILKLLHLINTLVCVIIYCKLWMGRSNPKNLKPAFCHILTYSFVRGIGLRFYDSILYCTN